MLFAAAGTHGGASWMSVAGRAPRQLNTSRCISGHVVSAAAVAARLFFDAEDLLDWRLESVVVYCMTTGR